MLILGIVDVLNQVLNDNGLFIKDEFFDVNVINVMMVNLVFILCENLGEFVVDDEMLVVFNLRVF